MILDIQDTKMNGRIKVGVALLCSNLEDTFGNIQVERHCEVGMESSHLKLQVLNSTSPGRCCTIRNMLSIQQNVREEWVDAGFLPRS